MAENESITFTFVYKGKEYQEVRSSATDQMQNKIIEEVLSTNSYSVHQDVEQENKFFLFDSSEELKTFFGLSGAENARLDCNSGNSATGGYVANLVLYRDTNYQGRRDRSPGWIFGSGPDFLWTSYTIDNYPNAPGVDGYPSLPRFVNGPFPCSLSLPGLGGMNDKTSSLAFTLIPYASASSSLEYRAGQQNQRVAVILYNRENYQGISLYFTLRGYEPSLLIPKMSSGLFYDFFGIKYGPSWNDKISSLEMYFQ